MFSRIKRYIKRRFTTKEIVKEQIPVYFPVLNGELLKNRVALITGASSGIGFGIAEQFVRQGCSVIITGRNESKLKDACNRLGEFKTGADYIVWDHADVSSIEQCFEKAICKFGKIDILVNNAGYHGNQEFFTISEDDYDNTFNVNLKNVFFMCQTAAKYMKTNHIEGNILNICSASAMKPAWSPYEISKWAVRGFTRGLARELAPYSITVNGIAPGPAATEMTHWKEGKKIDWPQIPKGRMVMPTEIGNLAVYLCSDLGKFIIGETVFCDGGSGTLTSNK